MNNFIGHIQARIDSKGRLLLPAVFKKNLSAQAQESFIIKKDIFEQCLVLYPLDQWQDMVMQLHQGLNPYDRQHNMFLRKFFSDTAQINLDSSNRLLIPRRLLNIVGIEQDVILLGVGNKIELWAPQVLQDSSISDEEFTNLAEKIFNNNNKDD